MSRYIDADKLLEELQEEIDIKTSMYTAEQNKYFEMGLRCAYRDVKKHPTADVVEVVRCMDCLFFTGSDYDGCCIKNGLATRYARDYCNYGERSRR